MELLPHLNEYYRGERLGGIVFTFVGALLLVCAVLLWTQGTPGSMARGMLVPILLVGLGGAAGGPFLVRSNTARLERMPQELKADAAAFIATDHARMIGVNKAWIPLKIFWTVLLAGGVVLAFQGGAPYWKGLGLALLLAGALGHMADGFAHERANVYTQRLEQARS